MPCSTTWSETVACQPVTKTRNLNFWHIYSWDTGSSHVNDNFDGATCGIGQRHHVAVDALTVHRH